MAETSGIEFGLCLPQFQADAQLTLTVAETAEADGYDVLSLFDHLRPLGGAPERPILECLTMLTAVAYRTSRVRVLPLVLRASLRPPSTVASALRTIEGLAPGRVVCGVGAGDRLNEGEDLSVGLPPLTAAERREALLDLIAALRTGASGVPIWVGGMGPTVRAIAGEQADGWNAWAATAEVLSGAARDVFAAAAAAARPRPRVTWGGQVLLGSSAADARERFATWSVGRSDRDLTGLVHGEPAAVAEQLDALVEAGVQTFLLSFVGPGAGRARRDFPQAVPPLVRGAAPTTSAK